MIDRDYIVAVVAAGRSQPCLGCPGDGDVRQLIVEANHRRRQVVAEAPVDFVRSAARERRRVSGVHRLRSTRA